MIDIALILFAAPAAPADTGSVKSTAAAVISLAWIIIAYAALPLVAKTFFGFLGTIAGAVNDRSRGGFDRLKKYRQGKAAKNVSDLKTGNRFKNREFTNPITGKTVSPGRRMNTLTRGIATGGAGHFGVGQRGEQAQHQAIETAANEVAKSHQFAAISQYDDAMKAGTYDSEREARMSLTRTKRAGYQKDVASGKISAADADVAAARDAEAGIQAYKATGNKFGDRAVQYAAARQLVSTGTGYANQEDMESTLARVSHGNQAQIGGLAGFANSETKNKGRPDLAPGAANLINRVQQRAGVLPVGAAPVSAAVAQEGAWNSVSLYQHANSKPQNIKAAIDHYSTEMKTGDRAKMKKAAVFFEELRAVQPNASGSVSNEINTVLKQYDAGKGSGNLGNARDFLLNPPGAANVTTTSVAPSVEHVTHVDPATGNRTVTPRTVTNNVTRTTTERDRIMNEVHSSARTYQRPDPNNMQ